MKWLHHSAVCPVTVIELSAEVAALQIAVLNTREELRNSFANKVTSGEQSKVSAGDRGDPKHATGPKQEDTKILSATESIYNED